MRTEFLSNKSRSDLALITLSKIDSWMNLVNDEKPCEKVNIYKMSGDQIEVIFDYLYSIAS